MKTVPVTEAKMIGIISTFTSKNASKCGEIPSTILKL
jgi:hypothetical protein